MEDNWLKSVRYPKTKYSDLLTYAFFKVKQSKGNLQ